MALATPAEALDATPLKAGFVEEVAIGEPPVWLSAKLDTGAETSAIHAPVYAIIAHDGVEYARFRLLTDDWRLLNVERPVLRRATILKAGAAPEERPVVALPVCIGGVRAEAEFTLADRTGLKHKVLIGRSFLAGRVIVDAGRTGLVKGGCGTP
ncbi:MAG: RimK/LysX family protein [Hyphomicrobiaceae bacterium]